MNTPMDQWTDGPMDQCAIDPLLRDLPCADPGAACSARVRARCHRAMNRRVVKRPLESVIVGGFCAVYVTGLALLALETFRLL